MRLPGLERPGNEVCETVRHCFILPIGARFLFSELENSNLQ